MRSPIASCPSALPVVSTAACDLSPEPAPWGKDSEEAVWAKKNEGGTWEGRGPIAAWGKNRVRVRAADGKKRPMVEEGRS